MGADSDRAQASAVELTVAGTELIVGAVALLVGQIVGDAVAAELDDAVTRTTVEILDISVVAFFAETVLDGAVSARLDLTCGRASVSRSGVTVVAVLVTFEHAVPAEDDAASVLQAVVYGVAVDGQGIGILGRAAHAATSGFVETLRDGGDVAKGAASREGRRQVDAAAAFVEIGANRAVARRACLRDSVARIDADAGGDSGGNDDASVSQAKLLALGELV